MRIGVANPEGNFSIDDMFRTMQGYLGKELRSGPPPTLGEETDPEEGYFVGLQEQAV